MLRERLVGRGRQAEVPRGSRGMGAQQGAFQSPMEHSFVVGGVENGREAEIQVFSLLMPRLQITPTLL